LRITTARSVKYSVSNIGSKAAIIGVVVDAFVSSVSVDESGGSSRAVAMAEKELVYTHTVDRREFLRKFVHVFGGGTQGCPWSILECHVLRAGVLISSLTAYTHPILNLDGVSKSLNVSG
jgi:hypothetical protein